MTKSNDQMIDDLLTEIAKRHLGLETLESRRSDSLDFSDQAVWCIRDALMAAYGKGMEIGVKVARGLD